MSLDKHDSRSGMQEEQLNQLNTLAKALRGRNPFHDERLKNLPNKLRDVHDWSEMVPFTLRADYQQDQQEHPPYGSNWTAEAEAVLLSTTSGTSTQPIFWRDDKEGMKWLAGNWKKVYQTAGLKTSDVAMFAWSFGPQLMEWTAIDAARRFGMMCLPVGSINTVGRLKMIIDCRVSVLFCTPSYALRLGEIAREENIDLSQSCLRRIIVGGEPGGSITATRQRIEKVWPGARVLDTYCLTETGPVAYPCPVHADTLHILSDSFYAEVVAPESDNKMQPGFVGELILTTLGRHASPALRFRTGDLVKRGPRAQCSCGSFDLALEGGIIGRLDNLVFVRGISVYPSAVEELIRRHPQVLEYRVEVKSRRSMTEMAVKLELVAGTDKPQKIAKTLALEMQTAFGLKIPVEILPEGSLERGESSARRWHRL